MFCCKLGPNNDKWPAVLKSAALLVRTVCSSLHVTVITGCK